MSGVLVSPGSLNRAGAGSGSTSSTLPVTRKGFRLFFLGAAGFAVVALPVWLLALGGMLGAVQYDFLSWHRHEMVFGFTTAVIAGFLLTAVSSWTGRETLVGAPLAALFALWGAGRFVFFLLPVVGPVAAAVVDGAFLPALAFAVGRPIITSGSRRNYGVLGILLVLTVANTISHGEALGLGTGLGRQGALLGIDLVTTMMLLVSARVVPMFTRNATGISAIRSSPMLDRAVMASMLGVLVASALDPGGAMEVPLLLGTSVLVVARTRHWGFRPALGDPLLWILHLGHLWIAAGLALRGLSPLASAVPPQVGVHAVTVGGIGLLTLGMMARVALGHTGRPLRASRGLELAFLLMALAVPIRVVLPVLAPTASLPAWVCAGALWTLAFAIYLVELGPLLLQPRADGRDG